jgi:hypothetical protein
MMMQMDGGMMDGMMSGMGIVSLIYKPLKR